MKDLLCLALTMLPSIAAMSGAVLLAYNGCKGWGWFILAAIIVFPSRIHID